MTRKLTVALLLIASVAPVIGYRAQRASRAAPDSAHQTIRYDGRERSYILRAPPALSPNSGRVPLVIVLHGGGGNARNAEIMTERRRLAVAQAIHIHDGDQSVQLANARQRRRLPHGALGDLAVAEQHVGAVIQMVEPRGECHAGTHAQTTGTAIATSCGATSASRSHPHPGSGSGSCAEPESAGSDAEPKAR